MEVDEDLIMFDESDHEELYNECSDEPIEEKDYDPNEEDKDFNPNDAQEPQRECISFKYKAKIVALAEQHPKWNLKTLQKHGASRLRSKRCLERWKKSVRSGGTRFDKLHQIDSDTFERFKEARSRNEQVTTKTLQQWALDTATPFQSKNFSFQASLAWVTRFKRKHRIKQRRTRERVGDRDVATSESADKFQVQTRKLIPNFDSDLVINTCQTGCSYQTTSDNQEAKAAAAVKRRNFDKTTHFFTAQYGLTASGKLLPLVFLCVQEPADKFGPEVSQVVQKLEKEFGNIVVTCSKSGQLTKDLYRHYLETTLAPYVRDKNFLLIVDSWAGETDPTLHNEVFRNASGDATCTLKVVPGEIIQLCQPCEVFYRQVEILTKRLQDCSSLSKEEREIASLEDALRIHSVVHHQLSAPCFKNMIKHAWYAAKLVDEKAFFRDVEEVCFPVQVLKENCSCGEIYFIKCSWCAVFLCFKCFYDDYHPKSCVRKLNGIITI